MRVRNFLREFGATGGSPRHISYFIFFNSESTFLNPAGTSRSEASTAFAEKLLISVVISSSDPGAPDGCPPDAGALAGAAGCSAGFFLPSPNLPPKAPPSAPPIEGGGADGCCCAGAALPSAGAPAAPGCPAA